MSPDLCPELIVMLTYNDFTVTNALDIFNLCRESKAKYWGFKEKPLPVDEMKLIYNEMKSAGKQTFLEVVSYTEDEGLEGAHLAAECGCDYLMGTKYFPSIAEYCNSHLIKYLPFVGEITGRPSVLTGSVEEIVKEAVEVINNGAYGIDLLGYRYVGDAPALNKALVKAIDAPVCIAGSIDSMDRLKEIKETAPAFFTIGSAFFDNKFGEDFPHQIDRVCNFMIE